MRPTSTLTTLAVLGGLALPAPAHAEGGHLPPVEPTSTLGAELDGRFQSVETLDTVHSGLSLHATFTPHPQLELGAAWGVRVAGSYQINGPGRTHVGVPPLRLWVGTGGASGDWRFGLRLEGGLGLELLGAAGASSNGEWSTIRIQGVIGWRYEWMDARVAFRGGAAYAGESAWAGVGDARVGVSFIVHGWSTRPYVEGRFFASTDMGYAARAGLGLITRIDDHWLRVGFTVGFPDDPTGLLFALQIGWLLDLSDD